jgi:hypothetical protein
MLLQLQLLNLPSSAAVLACLQVVLLVWQAVQGQALPLLQRLLLLPLLLLGLLPLGLLTGLIQHS